MASNISQAEIFERAQWAKEKTLTKYLPHNVNKEVRKDGSIILTSAYDMSEPVANTGVWLHRWAEQTPDVVAIRERYYKAEGWREITYAQLLKNVRNIAAVLLSRGLTSEDCIVVMSGNGADHLMLSLGAQYIGVPIVPLAEQYSLITEAHGRLIYVLDKVLPKMAFVDDAHRYSGAIGLKELDAVEVIASHNTDGARKVTPFDVLLAGDDTQDVDAAHAKVGPDTVAKILFTSGSTSDPKGVLTTQRMMCANQEMIATALPCLTETPPEITDWLPWNHVFGGSHNVNMMLRNGGTLNIDSGKPTKKGLSATLENRADHPGNLFFNVPVGFAMQCEALKDDEDLRKKMFDHLDLIFYAGASLPQEVWSALEEYSLEAKGGLPLMISSWGLTETAPANLMVHEPIGRSGVIGVPLPGVEVKLLPDDDMRCEIRVKGPNVMTGYYHDADKTAEAFDEEGFFITGDAVRFIDIDDPSRGLLFDGRVSEDFKLLTGTWVQAGNLRMRALEYLKGLADDVVICGHDRDEIGLFVFPAANWMGVSETAAGAIADETYKARLEEALDAMNHGVTGSAKRVVRALALMEPPSLEAHEVTDKGSLNVKKLLTRRAEMVERLYDNEDPALIRL